MKAVQFAAAAAAALALLALVPGAAAAQDGRTVEGAQEFLATQTGAGNIAYLQFANWSPRDRDFTLNSVSIQPRAARSVGRCATEFTDPSSDSLVIDWSRVSEVGIVGDIPTVWGGVDGGGNAMLLIESPQMRERVSAAMQFLKAQCDSSRVTGF